MDTEHFLMFGKSCVDKRQMVNFDALYEMNLSCVVTELNTGHFQ